MKWAVITLTKGAAKLGVTIADGMNSKGEGALYISDRFIDEYTENSYAINPVKKPFKDFVGELFVEYDALIFVMATGIVCRSIAPYIQSKTKDPAIIVCDEAGRHAISLLSGHLGGGNELSIFVADICGGEPVITTASDVTGNIAVDMLAKSIDSKIASMERAKDVTAIAVDGKTIGILIDKSRYENQFYREKLDKLKSDKVFIQTVDIDDDMIEKYSKEENVSPESVKDKSEGINKNKTFDNSSCQINSIDLSKNIIRDYDILEAANKYDGVIIISENKLLDTLTSVQLIPQSLHLGIGCKKDTSEDVILRVFNEACELAKVDKRAIKSISTIELKSKEAGIHALCTKLNLELDIIDLEGIKQIQNNFVGSDFVEKTIGVRAVSEPCAQISGDKNGYMRLGRYAKDGVTISLWEDL